jgi:hypothetical protein
MEKSKLIDLLKTFDAVAFRRFKEFVASPYFNKNEDLVRFLSYLEERAPDFPSDKIEKDVVFRFLFPEEALDKKKMAHLMNYLLRLGEQFLAMERYQEEDMLINCHTLDQFVGRKLDKHYNYLFNKTRQSLEEQGVTDGENYYYQYLLSRVASDHFISQQVRAFDPSLQKASDELDKFYFFHKLKYSCEMLNRQAIIAADYHLTFMEEVQAYLQEQKMIDPLIEIYLMIYLSISKPDEEHHFEKLMDLIERQAEHLNRKIRREIYLYAINYCAPKIRQGRKEYLSIMLDLYVNGIQNRSLFDEEYLSHWTYTNVVKLALRLQRYEWGENFIRKYADSLPAKLAEDAKHFNLAELYFHKKDYDEVLSQLNQLHFSDMHYHLGTRIILLKTYYEQDSEEPLLSLLASFSIYLRRNKKISATAKKTCLNFCNLLNQILRRKPSRWEQIGEDIRQTQPLAERAWLNQVWQREAGHLV